MATCLNPLVGGVLLFRPAPWGLRRRHCSHSGPAMHSALSTWILSRSRLLNHFPKGTSPSNASRPERPGPCHAHAFCTFFIRFPQDQSQGKLFSPFSSPPAPGVCPGYLYRFAPSSGGPAPRGAPCLSLSLSIYIYICICIYVYVCIYIYRERDLSLSLSINIYIYMHIRIHIYYDNSSTTNNTYY